MIILQPVQDSQLEIVKSIMSKYAEEKLGDTLCVQPTEEEFEHFKSYLNKSTEEG